MAKRLFKCSKCDRRFSMAAHLGRHMSTMHVSKKAKVAQKKKRRAVAKKRRAPVTTRAKPRTRRGLDDVLGSLRAYRSDLAAQREQLDAQRDQLDAQVQSIDDALKAMGYSAGAARRPGAGRRRRKGPPAGSLKDYIGRVLRRRSRGLSVKNIAAGVKKAGYRTKSKTLGHAIGKALADMKNVVRVGRGIYRLK